MKTRTNSRRRKLTHLLFIWTVNNQYQNVSVHFLGGELVRVSCSTYSSFDKQEISIEKGKDTTQVCRKKYTRETLFRRKSLQENQPCLVHYFFYGISMLSSLKSIEVGQGKRVLIKKRSRALSSSVHGPQMLSYFPSKYTKTNRTIFCIGTIRRLPPSLL